LGWAAPPRHSPPPPPPPARPPPPPPPPPTLIAGLALVLLGAGFGLWLILIGAGVSALGLGGLVREALARRRHRGGAEAA
jgi:hypothetical protein